MTQKSIEKALEIIAVISGLLYAWLYLNNESICWYFAFIGAAIFTWLCYKRNILAEAGLQVFYMVMAIYGFLKTNIVWQEDFWSLQNHFLLLGSSIAGTILLSFILKQKTQSALPLTDSFTTVFAISGTLLMVNMVHINWAYWIAVDAISIYLYYKRGMKFGAFLFLIYLIMAIDGFFKLQFFY